MGISTFAWCVSLYKDTCAASQGNQEKARISHEWLTDGIVNLFSSIDELSPLLGLFRVFSAKNGAKLPENEDLFPTLRGK
jgi:hypothetical protein